MRSREAATLLLDLESEQEVVELVVSIPNDTALRDLELPVEAFVLSVFRNRASPIYHGYTRLQMGDRITAIGSESFLEEVGLRFSN